MIEETKSSGTFNLDEPKIDENSKEFLKVGLKSKCDIGVLLRSCEHEIIEPVHGIITGEIPSWINGSLLRNGPGKLQVGEDRCKHLFDAAALLHRFNIADGKVTYQCKFLQSDSYKKNLAANRIVVSEFATAAVPDPCQSIFKRFAVISMSFG
jgi:carotenoid isomerooxygenase